VALLSKKARRECALGPGPARHGQRAPKPPTLMTSGRAPTRNRPLHDPSGRLGWNAAERRSGMLPPCTRSNWTAEEPPKPASGRLFEGRPESLPGSWRRRWPRNARPRQPRRATDAPPNALFGPTFPP